MKRHSCVHFGYKLAPEWQENMAMANMNYGMPQGDVQPPSADPQVQWWVQKSRGLQIDTSKPLNEPGPFWGYFLQNPPKKQDKKPMQRRFSQTKALLGINDLSR